MRTEPRRTPSLLVPLLALLLLALVTAVGGWIAGGVVAVLGLLLLPTALGHQRRGEGAAGGEGWSGADSWGGDSGCDSGDAGGGDGGGCGGE